MSTPQIIGLSGYAGVGKDEVGRRMMLQHGFQRISFAGPLKEMALAAGWDGRKDHDGRIFLQDFGTIYRKYNDRFWIDKALAKITSDKVVFTDVRYLNEVDAVRAMGGKIIRVIRPNVGPVNEHPSEKAIDRIAFDGHITNGGTVQELWDLVDAMVSAEASAC